MEIQTLINFFMWSTILNVGLLILSIPIFTLTADYIYKLHNNWFPMARETFNVLIYSLIGIYKIIIFVFSLVPWLALIIIS
ncbi:DUF6868 family protein [Natroniella sulfidigena]|uniref:DUF6868 family protein n=1 Tax=Natroniella sulfidigena TaxID=723921 RepID=UPI003D0EF5BF